MTGKMKFYIGLLVLGVAVMGGGLWQIFDSPPEIDIPEGNPVIYEKIAHVMRGEFSYLYIYGDGSIIYIEEKGFRSPPSPLHPPTRTWRTGKFTLPQVESLVAYFENSGLDELDEYQFPGEPAGGGDMRFTITVNSDNRSKTVMASGYRTPDGGETYPDMPPPLGAIYGRLRLVAIPTQEVYQENIKD